ncbi:MAG: lipocalin-like domain-containing protein [Acidimicrobiales bacterium]
MTGVLVASVLATTVRVSAAVASGPGPAPSGACAGIPVPASPVAPSVVAAAAAPVGSAAVRVPRDEAPHGSPVEWWYFSGHLRGTGPSGLARCYGFEYVTFQILGLTPLPAYVGNFAVTDLSRRSFRYGVETGVYLLPATKSSFSLHTGGWSMSGGSGHDVLHADLPGYSLDLHLQSTEPAVLEGDGGSVSLGLLGTSKYYSWTSLVTTGTMVDHGVDINVTGLSWMDHQWGPLDLSEGGGWDWFSVQLSNGQQYMVDFVRNRKDQIISSFATHVSSAGRAVRLTPVSERPTGSWRSPATGLTYSSGWQLTVPGGHLDIAPDLRDQELDLRSTPQGNAYWEGDVSVQGVIGGVPVTGVGYTELNPPGATPPPSV